MLFLDIKMNMILNLNTKNLQGMTRPSVALLQHAPNEGGGVIEEIIFGLNIPFRRIEIFSDHEIPLIEATHLVVMGGAMSVNDEKELPWLIQEKKLIREYIGRGAPVFGICLGAQLIASAGGANVYPCEPELGWSVVTKYSSQFALLPERFMAFQMHGETFDLPGCAELVCKGNAVHNQALSWGSALGFQFHVELTEEMICSWLSEMPQKDQTAILHENRFYLPHSQDLCRMVTKCFLGAPSSGFSWL
jgi:GMP synthase-like glutamine amidotransferase